MELYGWPWLLVVYGMLLGMSNKNDTNIQAFRIENLHPLSNREILEEFMMRLGHV